MCTHKADGTGHRLSAASPLMSDVCWLLWEPQKVSRPKELTSSPKLTPDPNEISRSLLRIHLKLLNATSQTLNTLDTVSHSMQLRRLWPCPTYLYCPLLGERMVTPPGQTARPPPSQEVLEKCKVLAFENFRLSCKSCLVSSLVSLLHDLIMCILPPSPCQLIQLSRWNVKEPFWSFCT